MNEHHKAHAKKGPRAHHWFLGLVVIVALGAGARWWLQHRAAPATATQPVQTAVAQDKGVQSLLQKAQAALRAGHFTEPAGDNALEYYLKALAIDPKNTDVKKGLEQVATQLRSRFEDFMKSGKLDEAAQALASLKQAIPKDAHLAELQLRMLSAQISKAVSDGKLDHAKELVHQAEQSGAVAAETLKKWEEDIREKASAATK